MLGKPGKGDNWFNDGYMLGVRMEESLTSIMILWVLIKFWSCNDCIDVILLIILNSCTVICMKFYFLVVDESSPLLYVWRFGNSMNLWKPWTICINLIKLGVIGDYITCICCFGSNSYGWNEKKNRVLYGTPLAEEILQFSWSWVCSEHICLC